MPTGLFSQRHRLRLAWARRGWRAAAFAAALVALGLAACGSPRRTAPRVDQAASASERGGRGPEQVRPPVDLAQGALAPLDTDAWGMARLPLAEVLDRLRWPVALPTSQQLVATTTATAGQRGEPSLAVQLRYLRARVAQTRRQYGEAVRHLHAAQRQQPDEPRLAQKLGQLYFDIGRRSQGAAFLIEALQAGSLDPYSLVLLGMQALHEQDDQSAAAYLYAAQVIAQRGDPVIEVIARYHFGVALMRLGYLAAGREQLEHFLTHGIHLQRTTRYARELYVLQQQAFATLVQVGDASHRLGETETALHFYREADRLADDQRAALLPRLVYTLLRTGRDEQAYQVVLDALEPSPDVRRLEVLDYLIANAAARGRLADMLMRRYRAQSRPSALAERIARLYDDAAAVRFLAGHLAHRPDDRQVFAALAHRAGQAGSGQLALLTWEAAVEALEAIPAAIETYGDVLAADPAVAKALTRAWPRLRDTMRTRPQAVYLQARMLMASGRGDRAAAMLATAIERAPRVEALRLAGAQVEMRRGALDRAEALLTPVEASPRAQALRGEILRRRGEPEAAMKLFEALVAADPGQIAWVLEAAALQRQVGRPSAAAATLGATLAREPQAVAIYEALFDLYVSTDAPADAGRQLRMLAQLARTHIPDARITVYRTAIEFAAAERWTQTERLCRDLLVRDPRDAEALELLVHALLASDQRDAADQLLRARLSGGLDGDATQQAVMRLAALDMSAGRWDAAEASLGRLDSLKTLTSPADYLALRGRLLLHRDPNQHSVEAVERLATRLRRAYPDHEADLAYEWAMLLTRMGRDAAAEEVLIAAVARFAEHGNLANALGYTWADQGRRLEKAQALIERALAIHPRSAAYLDSMGWVLYKQGRIAEAAVHLQDAVARPGGDHPVLITHWADALYRLGEVRRAAALWEAAQARLVAVLDASGEDADPESKALAPGLEARLRAVSEGRPAPVAPVVGAVVDEPRPALPQAPNAGPPDGV